MFSNNEPSALLPLFFSAFSPQSREEKINQAGAQTAAKTQGFHFTQENVDIKANIWRQHKGRI
jgi:hypothetical protein